MTNRRTALIALGASALTTPRLVSAQSAQPAQQTAPSRIAFLSPVRAGQGATRVAAFKEGLRDNGLIEGQHYVYDAVYADGYPDRFPALAQELLQRNPTVIVTVTIPAIRALQAATKTVPIVFVATADPVGNGLVASLARPGGNTTGISGQQEDLVAKHVELLHEALPRAKRIALLVPLASAMHAKMLDRISGAASGFGMSARGFEVASPAVLDAALDAIAGHRPDALLILASPMFYGERERIAAAMQKARIPVFAPEAEFVDAGCLISYATPYTAMFRYAALMVKKIVAGAKPADLPVEQPTRFEMVLNLRSAKALGITLPKVFMLRADRVIE